MVKTKVINEIIVIQIKAIKAKVKKNKGDKKQRLKKLGAWLQL